MDEEEKQLQEQEQNNIAQEATKQAVKQAENIAKEKVKQKVLTKLLPIIIKLVIFILAIILATGIIYIIKDKISQIAKGIGDAVTTICGIGDNGPVIPGMYDVIDSINKELEENKISKKGLSLGNELQSDIYLYKYMSAALSTEMPYIPGSNAPTLKRIAQSVITNGLSEIINKATEIQGIVHIKRTETDVNSARDLKFIKYESFTKKIENKESDTKNYFSIDENWNLCVAKSYKVTVNGVVTEYNLEEVKIPYRTLISQYTVPFMFLIDLQQITSNAEYVSAVADLISDNGYIEFMIFDSIETTTEVYTEKYKLNTKKLVEEKITKPSATTGTGTSTAGTTTQSSSGTNGQTVAPSTTHVPTSGLTTESGNIPGTQVPRPGNTVTTTTTKIEPSSEEKEQTTITVIEEDKIIANVTKANVWVIDQTTEYTSTDLGSTNEINNDLGSENEPADPTTVGDSVTWKTDQTTNTKQTINGKVWQAGETKTKISASKFLGLWRNRTGIYIPGAEYVPEKQGGIKVQYQIPSTLTWQSPVTNIYSAEQMLYTLLENGEGTQNHAVLMRYLIKLYKSGKALEDADIDLDLDLSIFNPTEFTGNLYSVYGNSIQEKVWFALRNAGYSEYAAAGAMGNIHYESGGFNVSAIEGGTGEGIGLCQWSFGRKESLKKFAASRGKNWADEDIQVEFLIGELTPSGGANGFATYQLVARNGYTPNDWISANNVGDSARAFCYTFERPKASAASSSMSDRITWANKYYQMFAGRTAPSGDSSGDLIRYYQGDYGHVKYGSGSIASSGCGPTCFAMVATKLSGNTITPEDAIRWCGNTYYVSGQGTSWSYFAAAARHFNINIPVQTNSFSSVENALKNGRLVISSQGPGLFTKGGHYIVLVKMVDGKIYVNDPNKHNAVYKGYNDRGFTPAEIKQAAKQYWIF